jgi:peptidoglycan/xylan/chitin deacetylase (PgdA/CDA1 family)
VSSGPTDRAEVALTFHTNGDVAVAHQLLDVLDAHATRVTAFIVGNWLQQHPDWAQRLVSAGHELANHTQTHPVFGRLTTAQMREETIACRDVLRATSGSGGQYFRPSGTSDGTTPPSARVLTVAGDAGYPTVLGFDVDPGDYADPGAAAVASRTIAGLHPGAIVSLHFGHAGTVAAMPAILRELERRALTPVTASQLLR